MNEEYIDIPGYEGEYQISNLGNVKSFKRYPEGVVLRPGLDKDGYLVIILYNNNERKGYKVHKLMAMTFLNHIPDGSMSICVDHINNNKLDNRVDNLQLMSNRENSSKDRTGGTSKYVGVYWDKSCSKWKTNIYINNKNIHLGLFNDELEAFNVYQRALNNINSYNGNAKEFRNFIKV